MQTILRLCIAMTLFAGWASAQGSGFNGKWKLIEAASSDLEYFREATLDFCRGPGRGHPRNRAESQTALHGDP